MLFYFTNCKASAPSYMFVPGSTQSFLIPRIVFNEVSQGSWLLFKTFITLTQYYIMLGHTFNSAEAVNHGRNARTVPEVWKPLMLPLSLEKCRAEPWLDMRSTQCYVCQGHRNLLLKMLFSKIVKKPPTVFLSLWVVLLSIGLIKTVQNKFSTH